MHALDGVSFIEMMFIEDIFNECCYFKIQISVLIKKDVDQ